MSTPQGQWSSKDSKDSGTTDSGPTQTTTTTTTKGSGPGSGYHPPTVEEVPDQDAGK